MATYKTIRMFSEGSKKNKRYKHSIEQHEGERVIQENRPSSLGFMHYCTIDDKTAFDILKKSMLQDIEIQMEGLLKEAALLKKLKFGESK